MLVRDQPQDGRNLAIASDLARFRAGDDAAVASVQAKNNPASHSETGRDERMAAADQLFCSLSPLSSEMVMIDSALNSRSPKKARSICPVTLMRSPFSTCWNPSLSTGL